MATATEELPFKLYSVSLKVLVLTATRGPWLPCRTVQPPPLGLSQASASSHECCSCCRSPINPLALRVPLQKALETPAPTQAPPISQAGHHPLQRWFVNVSYAVWLSPRVTLIIRSPACLT